MFFRALVICQKWKMWLFVTLVPSWINLWLSATFWSLFVTFWSIFVTFVKFGPFFCQIWSCIVTFWSRFVTFWSRFVTFCHVLVTFSQILWHLPQLRRNSRGRGLVFWSYSILTRKLYSKSVSLCLGKTTETNFVVRTQRDFGRKFPRN